MWVPPVGRAPPGRPPRAPGLGRKAPALAARPHPFEPASCRPRARLAGAQRPGGGLQWEAGRGEAALAFPPRRDWGDGRTRGAEFRSTAGAGPGLAGSALRPPRVGGASADRGGASAGRWATTSPPLALPRSSGVPAAPPEAPPPSKLSRRMSRSSCRPLASGSPSAARTIRAFPLIC